jgi:hypothetical protein
MAEKKTGAAKHSADYRDREKKEAERLGIEKMTLVTAAGTKLGMAEAMEAHGYTQRRSCCRTCTCRSSPVSEKSKRGA